jgi:hypothetical protein
MQRSFVAVVMLVGSVVACSTSSSTPVVAADGGQDAGPGWTTGACGTCAASACGSARTSCDAEPTCATHASCVDACAADARGLPDAACVEACPKASGEAATRRRVAFDTCVTRTASGSCPACAGGVPDAGASTPDVLTQTCGGSTETNPCFACEDTKCCKTFDACVAEPECKQQLQPCIVGCKADKECAAACYTQHAAGVPAWARRQTCIEVQCSTECNNGTPIDPCLKCVWQGACRDSFARCGSSAACFLAMKCLERCDPFSEKCLADCEAAAPAEDRALLEAWLSCSLSACAPECSL